MIVGVIRRKPVLTHASIVCEGMLASVNSVNSTARRDDWTDDGTPVGPYATGHCAVVVYVRRTHDGTLARGIVQATGQTMRHV